MQQFACDSFCSGLESVENILHLNQVSCEETFRDSLMTVSDFDQGSSPIEDFNINFDNNSIQDFGLGYWMKYTSNCPQLSSPFHTSFKSVFNTKLTKSKIPYHKPKRSKKSDSFYGGNNCILKSNTKTNTLKNINSDIPTLKISKNLSQSQSQSSSESEFSSSSSKNGKKRRYSILKCNNKLLIPEKKPCSSSIITNYNCLEKSFENSKNSVTKSESPLSAINNDVMHLTLTIDNTIYNTFFGFDNTTLTSVTLKRDLFLKLLDGANEPKMTEKKTLHHCSSSARDLKDQNNSNSFFIENNSKSLSFACDTPHEKKKLDLKCYNEDSQKELQLESLTKINNIKRRLYPIMEEYDEFRISTKKKIIEPILKSVLIRKINDNKSAQNVTPIDYLRMTIVRRKDYENIIMEKYCLSQPNAMKFLAENHANNWELHMNKIRKMHLVPCEFLSEIFHRALHCFGLEKKMLKETLIGNSSPINGCHSSHSIEYKKIRDEYSTCLKRARYGIGVIDELFRGKVNYQNILQNNDVHIVRKWKHIIYYLCLHVKSAFMAKEIQYHNYVQFSSSSFDGVIDLYSNDTPSLRCPSNITIDIYNKSQCAKENSRLLECKLNQKITPEHLSHSDFEMSPHSYDSGKGYSIHTSSNANSLVSGCHTTSSFNSTPHSLQESQPGNLSGFQWYRIDEYQTTAQEYIRLLPEAFQLHKKILSIIGMEPNANSRDNIIKLIHYVDICLHLSRDDLMSECLQRLLSQATSL